MYCRRLLPLRMHQRQQMLSFSPISAEPLSGFTPITTFVPFTYALLAGMTNVPLSIFAVMDENPIDELENF